MMILWCVLTAFGESDGFVDVEEIVGPFLSEAKARAYARGAIHRRVLPLTPDPTAAKVRAV